MASHKWISGKALYGALLAGAILWIGSGMAGEGIHRRARLMAFEIDPGSELEDRSLYLSKNDEEQIDCLARNMYFEARDQGEEGMWAVTDVVFNRLRNPEFPGSVCEIITERGQFSWYWDGKPHVMRDSKAAKLAYRIALQAWREQPIHYKEKHKDLTEGAIRYHAFYVSPKWKSFRQTIQIGAHKFFKPKDPQS